MKIIEFLKASNIHRLCYPRCKEWLHVSLTCCPLPLRLLGNFALLKLHLHAGKTDAVYIWLMFSPSCVFCIFFSLKKLMFLLVRTGRLFTQTVSLWAQRSVQSSETASWTMGTGQWTSGLRAKRESLHTISLWGELEKVKMEFINLHHNYEIAAHFLKVVRWDDFPSYSFNFNNYNTCHNCDPFMWKTLKIQIYPQCSEHQFRMCLCVLSATGQNTDTGP